MGCQPQDLLLSKGIKTDLVRRRGSAPVNREASLLYDLLGDNPDLLPSGRDAALRRSSSKNERRLWIFLVIWFVAGVVQAIFTNLDGEEAYYAIFAKHLAWGYFDHPPAVAFFARLGMLLFPGDLGPRFMMVVLSTATLWIGSRLLEDRQFPLYIATVLGLVLIQAGSFLVKTDVPLLFFATLFFYFYREYLKGRERVCIAVLPIAIAGMLLSKYHGLLIVGLTLVSNLGIMRRVSFWIIGILSLALVFPHAVWLYLHDFVTIRYHLGGRPDAGLLLKNVLGYLVMPPFIFGPAVGVLLLPAALIVKGRDGFDKALKFNLIGALAFFFIASFGVRIHMHWLSVAIIPVLALGIPYIYDREALRKILMLLAIGSAVAFVPVRIYLAWDFLPAFVDRKMQIVHGWDKWAQDVRRLADGRCVVFLDDYGSAAKYTYYTGEMAQSYNSMGHQNSQHDLWPIEESFRGKRAMIVNGEPYDQFLTTYARNGAEIRYRFVDDFETYSKVGIELGRRGPLIRFVAEMPSELPVTLVNHSAWPVAFKGHTELAPMITYYFFKGPEVICWGACDVIAGITLEQEVNRTVELRPPAIPGDYTLRFAIRPGWLQPSNNGGMYAITVLPARQSSSSAGAGQTEKSPGGRIE
jgi:hypothetical protein